MPMAWWAMQASYGPGSVARIACAFFSASPGRENASGSSSGVPPGTWAAWRDCLAIGLMLGLGVRVVYATLGGPHRAPSPTWLAGRPMRFLNERNPGEEGDR